MSAQTRKPYTITKQREKWTDQEHSRFLDALRMYGRAWRRIEGERGAFGLFWHFPGLFPLTFVLRHPRLMAQSTSGRRLRCKSGAMLRSSSRNWRSRRCRGQRAKVRERMR